MNLLRLTALLIYTFGAFAYGAIFVLWLRQYGRADWVAQPTCPKGRRSEVDLVGGAITFVSFAWFAVSLLLTLISLNPGIKPWPLQTAFLVLAFLFPPLIMHIAYAEVRRETTLPRHPAWRLCLGAAYLLSQSISLSCILGFHGVLDLSPLTPNRLAATSCALLFTGAGIYSALAISRFRKKTETSEERSSRRWMLALFGALIFLCVPLILSSQGWIRFTDFLDVTLRSIPLAFLFVGTYFENRFGFFDLFIKRGLSLLLTIILLTAYFGLLLPRLEGFDPGWARPWVYAVALLPVALPLPWVYRKLGVWLDNFWLGRRFRTVEAVKYFLSVMKSATSERRLIEDAERGISEIFRAPVRIHLEDRAEPTPGFEEVLGVPIHSPQGRAGIIRLGPRANKTPFFSEDLTLLDSLADVFFHLLENVQLQEKKREQERLSRELSLHASHSELKALRAQINPHFLFNALNAIAGLIHKDPARADKTVEQLAEVFRYTLRRSESEWALLEDEMEFVRAYLEVEQARFGERFQFRTAMDEAVRAAKIPTMMVQTLAENAVKHGIAAVRGPGRIEIEARRDGDGLRIEVTDNGPGFPEAEAPKGLRASREESGYGLRNIRQRLHGYFGSAAQLVIRRDPARQLTVVSIVIPLSQDLPSSLARAPGRSAEPEGAASR